MAVINSTLKKAIYGYHSILGIVVALHLFILICTGLILLFKSELQSTQYTHTNKYVDTAKLSATYEAAYQYLLKTYPNDKPLDLYPDDHNPQVFHIRIGDKLSNAKNIKFDYETSKPVKVAPLPASKFYDWILSLHYQLFLGARGQIYIGVIGMAFVLMNLSGLYIFISRRRAGIKARSISRKIHQYLGITCLLWGLTVGLTGLFLGLNPVITKNFQKNTLADIANKYNRTETSNTKNASFQSIIEKAQQVNPDDEIAYIIFPGMERGLQNHYLILMHGKGLITKFINEYLVIDAKRAQLKEIINLPLFMQLTFVASPIHFVSFNSIILKIVWGIFAIATLVLASLGIRIFYIKKRKSCADIKAF